MLEIGYVFTMTFLPKDPSANLKLPAFETCKEDSVFKPFPKWFEFQYHLCDSCPAYLEPQL